MSRKRRVPQRRTNFFHPPRTTRGGFTVEEILNLTRIDRWSLTQIMEILDFEDELAAAPS
jgi:hypothetical protein